nr:reverse transcriptase domain-containing protein [Tanacetum cinerariifolium]
MSAMANTTPLVTTVTKPATNPIDADATPRVNIQEFCEEYYEDILPIIMDKVRRDRRKDVHTRLDFRKGPRERTREDSHHSSHRRQSALDRLSETYSPSTTKSRPRGTDSKDHPRGRSRPHRLDTSNEDCPKDRKRFRSVGESYDDSFSHSYHDGNRSRHMKRRRDNESPLSSVSKSDSSDGRNRAHKGAPECMKISGFMHGVNNPELTKRLNEHVPKTMEERMITTTAFIRGEAVAARKRKEGRGYNRFTPLTRTPKEILAAEAGKFQMPPPMVTPVEKRNNKFCDFHNDKGHSTDECSSMEILYEHCFNRLYPEIKNQMVPATTSLTGCSGETIWPLGKLRLQVTIGDADHSTRAWMNFMIVRSLSPYNGIIERPGIREIQAVPSTAHEMLKFPVKGGIVTIRSTILIPTECPSVMTSSMVSKEERTRPNNFKVALHPDFPDQEVTIGGTLLEKGRTELCSILKKNLDIFTWKPSDMTGVPRSVAEHRLNIREGYSPIRQKKRGRAPERAKAIQAEVQKLVEAGIMREVYYHDWLSNPVMVKKHDGSWRMYVDFTDLNKASYKGYHQIQLAELDEEKTAFHTGQGVYCYTKMPFSLKNAGATYQRLMDKAFNGQIGQNIEVYVDDLVVKSYTEAEILRNINEMFRALRKINMKLNPKKWLILTNPEGIEFTYALRFQFATSNNQAEYEALIAGLWIAAQMGVQNIHVSVDSKLVANQVLGMYVSKEENMVKYLDKVKGLEGGKKAPHQGPTVRIIEGNSLQAVVSYDVVKMCWTAPGGRIDIASPFPEGPGKVKFLVVAMDYFTKWIEVKAVATITGGQARMGEGNKHWVEELPHVLWAHRTMIKSSHGDTPFFITYGTEAVIPVEIGMPTYRTAAVDVVYNDEELRLNLDLLEERRERATICEAKAKLKMMKYYNARVRGVTFRPGDFVYRSNDASHAVAGGKLGPKWEGPYEVTETLGDGAYKLRSMDGTILPRTWNIANLKKCYL